MLCYVAHEPAPAAPTASRNMLALLAGSLSDVITFNKSPFHAVFAEGPDICITAHDIHRLTGSLDIAVGGKVAVHVDNGTIPDYTLTIGGPWGPKGPFMRRNVSATSVVLSTTCACCTRYDDILYLRALGRAELAAIAAEVGMTKPGHVSKFVDYLGVCPRIGVAS